MELTLDRRGDHHVKDLGAVASVDQLIGTERVKAQRTAARLVLCFHDDHHVETVAGKIFSLDDRKRKRHEKMWYGPCVGGGVLALSQRSAARDRKSPPRLSNQSLIFIFLDPKNKCLGFGLLLIYAVVLRLLVVIKNGSSSGYISEAAENQKLLKVHCLCLSLCGHRCYAILSKSEFFVPQIWRILRSG